jgi:sucrose phosphorylase
MMRVLLFHVRMGVRIIRLDAIAYLWKEIGHPSIHHPKTHAVVKLFRAVLEEAAPWVVIITETNVPHRENISYFGNMDDEAHMVYQFSLPPLVLDAFLREDAGHLRRWAAELPETGKTATFFNFLASHDGIGLLPAHGILSAEELENLAETVRQRGGRINYKATPEGEVPYELNITYLDAVAERGLDVSVRARKFLASQSVMLMLSGVPGIYMHSLLGSENYSEGVERTGANRAINRQKLEWETVRRELSDPASLRGRIFGGLLRHLRARRSSPAFDPAGEMEVLSLGRKIFGLIRRAPGGGDRVLCLVNVTPDMVWADVPVRALGTGLRRSFTDLIQEKEVEWTAVGESVVRIELTSYGIYFLRF